GGSTGGIARLPWPESTPPCAPTAKPARSTAANARHRVYVSRSRVAWSAIRIERTTPAGSTVPSRVTLATSLRRSSTRSHWIGDSSASPLMKAATSAWFGPYRAATFTPEGAGARLRGGLVIVLMALATVWTTSVRGAGSTWLRDAGGLAG